MLRKIICRVWYEGEEWETKMKRMNLRETNGLRQYCVKVWSERVLNMRTTYIARMVNLPEDRWEK